MKRSTAWFNKRVHQNTATNVAQLPLLAVLGPSTQMQSERREDGHGKKLFVVGESIIGEEEVVG